MPGMLSRGVREGFELNSKEGSGIKDRLEYLPAACGTWDVRGHSLVSL